MIPISENFSHNDAFNYESDSDRALKNLYRDYLRGVGLDCELISKEGTSIKIHASVLRDYSVGIEELASDTTGKMLVISFEKYSNLAIRVFVESLYLEVGKFQEKWQSAHMPIFEVLRFAHEYKQSVLCQFCIKTICHMAREEDAEKVFEVNKICQNYFLFQLYERLIQSRRRAEDQHQWATFPHKRQ